MDGDTSFMTNKQAAFVREYLVDSNATQGAIRAGYSLRTAEQQGCRLLTNVKVAQAIDAGQRVKVIETNVTKQRLVEIAMTATQVAIDTKDIRTVLRGVDLLARLHGHLITRTDVRVIRSLHDLTDEELDAVEASILRGGAR